MNQANRTDRLQQLEIKKAILQALPPDIYYHNLLIALAELLKENTERYTGELREVEKRQRHERGTT